ncbi:PP2C family protein-serine/threonine phosphatase [Ensifer adhaerens]|uniref:PP2C family protein-serine/threonine phosphatase n=1 Tax=Ensifer adhaerens TaxID=106592 RepID=UPI00384EB34D
MTSKKDASFTLLSAAATHRGARRETNQDAYICRPDIGLWAVADGIGGLPSGDKASQAVVDALGILGRETASADDVALSITRTNKDLRLEAAIDGAGAIGSTVVAFLCDEKKGTYTCLWAGDSRLYRFRRGELVLLTQDHTVAQFGGDNLKGRRAELSTALHRAVGTNDSIRVDRITGALEAGDVYLLCTDGLSKPVAHDRIAAVLSNAAPELIVEELIGEALKNGGPDNVAVAVIAFPRRSLVQGAKAWSQKAVSLLYEGRVIAAGVALVAFVAAGGAWHFSGEGVRDIGEIVFDLKRLFDEEQDPPLWTALPFGLCGLAFVQLLVRAGRVRAFHLRSAVRFGCYLVVVATLTFAVTAPSMTTARSNFVNLFTNAIQEVRSWQ